jgi:putative membrane protein
MGWFTSKHYPKHLLIILLVFWAFTFIGIKYPFDFFLEHIFTVLFLALLIFTHKKFRLSNVSYSLIFIYMILHIIGAHYTYSEVPYNEWSKALFGFDIQQFFNFQRNNYDRLVHFSFGLLMAYPVREIFLRIASVRGFWGYYFPLDVMASFSALYEIVEMGVALMLGGEVAQTYNGEQGDRWDAIKDMGMAITGGVIAMVTIFLINWRYKKGFWKDIGQSFSVKRKTPLGEVELQRMKKDR